MEKINFNEIEIGGVNNAKTERKTVSPGVDVFTIEEAEVKDNTNGKQYVAIKFVNKSGQYLREQFYTTTNNALKRVKELATNSGVVLGDETMDAVAARLIGNQVGLIVGGEKETANIDGQDKIVTRSKIKNAYNFSFRPADLESKKDSKIIIEDKTLTELPMDSGTASNDDLPF